MQQLLKRCRNQLSLWQTGESTAAQASARCLDCPCFRMYVDAIQCKHPVVGLRRAFPMESAKLPHPRSRIRRGFSCRNNLSSTGSTSLRLKIQLQMHDVTTRKSTWEMERKLSKARLPINVVPLEDFSSSQLSKNAVVVLRPCIISSARSAKTMDRTKPPQFQPFCPLSSVNMLGRRIKDPTPAPTHLDEKDKNIVIDAK